MLHHRQFKAMKNSNQNPFPYKTAIDAANAINKQNDLQSENEKKKDSQISTRLSEIRKLRDKLPATLGSSLFKIVYLPVVALFPNRNFTDTKNLNAAGIQTYQFPGNDLKDYPILANQSILLINFSKFDEMYSAKKKEESSENPSDRKKEMAEWKEAVSEWENKAEEIENEISEWFEAKEEFLIQQGKYEKYLAAAREYAEKMPTYGKDVLAYKTGKSKVKPVKLIKPVEVEAPEPLPPQPKEYDADDYKKPERPTPKKRNFSINIDDMADVVVELTRDLRELLNKDYVLMSAQHKQNNKSTDGGIICFWLVERWKYKKLEKFGRVTVNSWSFAFD